jgi:hypothetical protein
MVQTRNDRQRIIKLRSLWSWAIPGAGLISSTIQDLIYAKKNLFSEMGLTIRLMD